MRVISQHMVLTETILSVMNLLKSHGAYEGER